MNGAFSLLCDPGGILTPNPQSRNLMRYTIAPRSHYLLGYTPDSYRDAPQKQNFFSSAKLNKFVNIVQCKKFKINLILIRFGIVL